MNNRVSNYIGEKNKFKKISIRNKLKSNKIIKYHIRIYNFSNYLIKSLLSNMYNLIFNKQIKLWSNLIILFIKPILIKNLLKPQLMHIKNHSIINHNLNSIVCCNHIKIVIKRNRLELRKLYMTANYNKVVNYRGIYLIEGKTKKKTKTKKKKKIQLKTKSKTKIKTNRNRNSRIKIN